MRLRSHFLRAKLTALTGLAIALAFASIVGGCAASSGSGDGENNTPGEEAEGTAEDDFTSAAQGLWTLDGTAQTGDIELLQLGAQKYASLVRQPRTTPHASASGASPQQQPQQQPIIQDGNVASRTMQASSTANGNAGSAPTYSLSTSPLGDVLKLTASNGRVLTYRRSYRLYCVPTDRSVEATALLEMGKQPKIVGVNGDGEMFPSEGTYNAKVQTDVLFQQRNYVMLGQSGSGNGSKTIRVQLPWSDMSKAMIKGTLAIVGGPNSTSATTTPISCERLPAPP